MAGSNRSRSGSVRSAGGQAATRTFNSQVKKKVNTQMAYRKADQLWWRMNTGRPSPTTTAYNRQSLDRSYRFRERMSDRLSRLRDRALASSY